MQVDLPSNSRDFQISVHKFLPNQFIGRFKTIGNVYLKSFHIFCGQFTYCRHFTQRFIRQKLVDKISKFLPIDSVEFTQMMPIGCLQLFTVKCKSIFLLLELPLAIFHLLYLQICNLQFFSKSTFASVEKMASGPYFYNITYSHSENFCSVGDTILRA